MVDIQCAAAEIRRGKKEDRRKKETQDENIFHRATIMKCVDFKYK